MRRWLVLALVLAGCATGRYDWVTRTGGPPDPMIQLRCDEYVSTQTRPDLLAGFDEAEARWKCMRAHGYIKRWELEPR